MSQKWSYRSIEKQLDLVKGFLQLEGELKIDNIRYDHDERSGIALCGFKELDHKRISVGLDKYQLESLANCETVQDVYECYREMEYF